MIRPADIPAEVVAPLAALLDLKNAEYAQAYRAAVARILVEQRDAYPKGAPEHAALEKALLAIGAAPRDPLSIPKDLLNPNDTNREAKAS